MQFTPASALFDRGGFAIHLETFCLGPSLGANGRPGSQAFVRRGGSRILTFLLSSALDLTISTIESDQLHVSSICDY